MYTRYSNEIPMAGYTYVFGVKQHWKTSGNTVRRLGMLKIKDVWRPLTGSRLQITYRSVRIHDGNEIPRAIPMFSRSGNTERLVRIYTVRRLGMLEIKDGGH